MVPSIFGENMLDDFFDESFFGAHNPLYGKNARNLLKTDIREMDDSYELSVDLPGFKKDEISLDIKDGYLTVSAEKGLDKKEEDKKGRILRQERYAGVCSRSFYVGNVKPEDVKAKGNINIDVERVTRGEGEMEKGGEDEIEASYPGADAVELLNHRGDTTTVYKSAGGTNIPFYL